jgi:hypothetical protein
MLRLSADAATDRRRQSREGLDIDMEGLRCRLAVPHAHRQAVGKDGRVQPAPAIAVDLPPVIRRRHQVAILPPQEVLVPPRDDHIGAKLAIYLRGSKGPANPS